MIIKGLRVRLAGRIAGDVINHLLQGDENEGIRILQGNPADVHDMVADARRHARLFAFRHFVIAPAIETSTADMLATLDALAREFDFDATAAFVVEHRKGRSLPGAFSGHLHALVGEVDAVTGRVLGSGHSYPRQEKVARLEEARLGHPFVQGRHHKAVLAALQSEGYSEVARKLDRAFPSIEGGERPRAAYTDTRHAAAKRAGLDLPAARAMVLEAWHSAKTGGEVERALAVRGLVCRAGDKPGTWVVEAQDGTFVGSIARLVKARKADVIARMETPDVKSQSPGHNDGTRDLQDGPVDHPEPPPCDEPSEGRSEIGRGGRGPAPVDPRSSHRGTDRLAPRSGGAECSVDRAGSGSPSSEHARSAVTPSNKPSSVMGLLMTLAEPRYAHRLFALQASANREATAGHSRALAELAQVQEDAEYARRLAKREIEVSAGVIVAKEAASSAKQALRAAAATAAKATKLYHAHLAARPTGWRSFVAWVTRTMAQYDLRKEELRKVKLEAEYAEKECDLESRAADKRVEQAIELCERDAVNLRKARRQDADSAALRAEAATRVLVLLEQKPALACMGVEALLQLGRHLLDRESNAATSPKTVFKPEVKLSPIYG